MAVNSNSIARDLIDRLSFLFPGVSEIVSLGLGILLGALLVTRLQRRFTREGSNGSDDGHEVQLEDGKTQRKAAVLDNDTLIEPTTPHQAGLDREHSLFSPNHHDTSLSSYLADLPPPLRTTIHQPFDGTRPWTSADFVRHRSAPDPSRPLPPHRPWKRHTVPAMHITDHVEYYPLASETQCSEPEDLIANTTTHNPISDYHPNTTPCPGADTSQQHWRRRRILTFEPLPLPTSSAGSGTSEATCATTSTTSTTSTAETDSNSSSNHHNKDGPLIALQIQMEMKADRRDDQ